jgi:hypothetical protein
MKICFTIPFKGHSKLLKCSFYVAKMLNNCFLFIQLSRTNEFTNEILWKSAAISAGNATTVTGAAVNAIALALDDMALDVMDIVGLLADLSFHSSGANRSSESQVRVRTKFFFDLLLPSRIQTLHRFQTPKKFVQLTGLFFCVGILLT